MCARSRTNSSSNDADRRAESAVAVVTPLCGFVYGFWAIVFRGQTNRL
jgi:hypothetical protein